MFRSVSGAACGRLHGLFAGLRSIRKAPRQVLAGAGRVGRSRPGVPRYSFPGLEVPAEATPLLPSCVRVAASRAPPTTVTSPSPVPSASPPSPAGYSRAKTLGRMRRAAAIQNGKVSTTAAPAGAAIAASSRVAFRLAREPTEVTLASLIASDAFRSICPMVLTRF